MSPFSSHPLLRALRGLKVFRRRRREVVGGGLAGDLAVGGSTGASRHQRFEIDGRHLGDFPPESFWLSKDAEIDWVDKNAFYDRTESLKGNSNPNLNAKSSSHRYSTAAKSKRSFIGLPKTQKTSYAESTKNWKKNCNKPSKVKLFPKRTGSMNKPAVQLAEPRSPKVSLIGRVRSKRRNQKLCESVEKDRTGKGICKQFLSLFRSDRRSKPAAIESVSEPSLRPVEFCSRMKVAVQTGNEAEPAGLGAMKKFASGRKSSASAADVAN